MSNSLRIQGSFTRWRKSDPTDQDKTLPLGWFAVRSDWVSEHDRAALRGKWYKISCGGNHCYRSLSMDPTLKGSQKTGEGQINIDWDGWLALHGYQKPHEEPLELTIEPANRFQLLTVGHSHPDPGIRAAAIVASVSLGLGFLALVISVFLSFV